MENQSCFYPLLILLFVCLDLYLSLYFFHGLGIPRFRAKASAFLPLNQYLSNIFYSQTSLSKKKSTIESHCIFERAYMLSIDIF